MKIGILESRQDPFILDVVGRLKDFQTEFLSFKDPEVPVRSDCSVVVDRISFCHTYLREIVKNLSLGGVYVLNNPFAAFTTNKLVELKICQSLGISHPTTMLLPNQYWREDLAEIIGEPDFDQIVSSVGLPCVVKPFDGYGWSNVFFVSSIQELKDVYETKRQDYTLLVQQRVEYAEYYRAFCINKRDVLFIKWVPRPLALGEYVVSDLKPIESQLETMTRQTVTLNTALDLDVNAVEWCIDEAGKTWLIEAFNEVPDIDKQSIPQPYYDWIVDKFTNCVIDKAVTRARNKTIFGL